MLKCFNQPIRGRQSKLWDKSLDDLDYMQMENDMRSRFWDGYLFEDIQRLKRKLWQYKENMQ